MPFRRSLMTVAVALAGGACGADAMPAPRIVAVTPAKPAPLRVGVPSIAQIAAGGSSTCVRTSSGEVVCWGANDFGQLARPTTKGCGQNDGDCDPSPGSAPALHDIVSIALGTWHGCAVKRGGGLLCWGRNDHGQVGVVTRTCPSGPCAPIPVPLALAPVAEVAASWRQTCARTEDGRVACWGQNDVGQLGVVASAMCTGYACNPTPSFVDALGGAAGIALGDAQTCVLRNGAGPRCFGSNEHGQLDAPVRDVVEIALGAEHGCARTGDGEVLCWGRNDQGQAGVAREADQRMPVHVNVPRARRIAAGTSHTCAITVEGRVMCWGSRSALARTREEGSAPSVVAGVDGALEIAAGTSHTCARTERAVLCWGSNTAGQLGDGTTTDRAVPTPVRW